MLKGHFQLRETTCKQANQIKVRWLDSVVVVERDYEKDPLLISGQTPKLQQVFMNLILNARDVIPQSGTLEIATESDIDSIYVSFRGIGNGTSPEHLAHIYDPFFTTNQIGKGTRLGWTVSYGIVQDHDGQITMNSTLEQGRTFRIDFPAVQAHRQVAGS